jgi:hypothetical protein
LPDDAVRPAEWLSVDVPYEEAREPVVADARVLTGPVVEPVVALGAGAAGSEVATAAVVD